MGPLDRLPARRLRRPLWLVGAAVALLGVGAARAQGAPDRGSRRPPTVAWRVDEAVVTVAFHRETLAALGLALARLQPSARNLPHPLSIVDPAAPSFAAAPEGLRVELDDAVFRGFRDGALRLTGGFRLRHATGELDFTGAVLRAAPSPYSLELLDSRGEALLATAQAQVDLDVARRELRYMNADLRVLPALARRLGDERLAGTTVGVLALDATLAPGQQPLRALPAAASTPPACDDWSGEVDVALVDIDLVGQAGASAGGRVVVVPSVTLENVGTANVAWYSKFSGRFPPYGNDQHPFLAWQLLRARDGVLEPIGRSEVKHAFRTGNYNCAPGACTDPQILGIGCQDPYNISSNTYYNALGPRHEITASTGVWAHCDEPAAGTTSHFDADGDCVQDHVDRRGDVHAHGMKVVETALGDPASRYFMEAFYVIRDDVDVFNTMGFLEVRPELAGAVWTFPPVGAFTPGPVVDAWAVPATPSPAVDNRFADTGEGHVQLAGRVTDLGGGRWRYAYALQNHDFDRRIARVHVPFDASSGVTAIGFADGDDVPGDVSPGNNWTGVAGATGVTWTAPPAASPPADLDWATLFAFWFESDQAPGPALVTLGVAEAGAPAELHLQSVVPGGVAPTLAFHTVTPCRLLDTRAGGSGGGPVPSGRARVLDVPAVAACGVPAGAAAVAVNVTVTGATAGGHLTVYPADLPRPPATSTLGFTAGATRANSAVAALSAAGRLALRPVLAAAGSVHVLVDVVGYFGAAP